MNLRKLKKINIPQKPGCYFFYNNSEEIIYIGKAANLRSRVFSYWQKGATLTPAKQGMVEQVENIDWLEAGSEIEAMLLESNLIKKHQPHFNIIMRDDKRFVYIKISSQEEYPRISMTRKLDKVGTYFGPFTSTEAVKQTLKTIRKIWPFRTCVRMPRKPCLYYQINKCPGPCQEKISSKEYQKIIKKICSFLRGERKKVENDIKKEIAQLKKKNTALKKKKEDEEDLTPQIDRLNYQLKNLEQTLAHNRILELEDKYLNDVVELAKKLQLPKIPERIEGYDTSNLFGGMAVGAMVVFRQGEASKDDYRKFKLRQEGKSGDTAMLEEVLDRRLKKLNSNSKKSWPSPDLIIIDGGKAQLNTALKILKKYSLDIPVLAISKGGGLRSARARDKIFFPGQKQALSLPLADPVLHIIKRVRDEAHRFAISYHRQKKRKSLKDQH